MIGILDSGVGGLSVVNEIHRLLPQQSLTYLGDSAFCPYGNKPPETIIQRCRQVSEWLQEKGVGLIVIACNSATIAAVEALRAEFPLPFVGMEPGVKPACETSRSGVVGVLATEVSLAGEKFLRLVHTHARERVKVITRPCPRFVELVEAGECSGPEAENAVAEAIGPLTEAGADTLVLGCTHYPFLSPLIQQLAGPEVRLIDTGPAVARRVRQILNEIHGEGESTSTPASFQIHTTGQLKQMQRLLPQLSPAIARTKSLSIADASAELSLPQ